MWIVSGLAEELLASQEGLCSMLLVNSICHLMLQCAGTYSGENKWRSNVKEPAVPTVSKVIELRCWVSDRTETGQQAEQTRPEVGSL